jgi:outer membrane protein
MLKKMLILGLFSLLFVPVYAKDVNILVVDFSKLEKDSLAAKSLVEAMEGSQKSIKTEAESIQASFQKKAEGLQSQQSVLSKEAFEKKRKALESEAVQTQTDFQEKINKLEQKKQEALEKINEEIKKAASKVAKKHEAQIVIPSNFTIYSEESLDVTEEVLKNLNSSLKKVSL